VNDLRCATVADMAGVRGAQHTVGVGPDGTVFVATSPPPSPRDAKGRPRPAKPHTVEVRAYRDGVVVARRTVADVPFDVHHVQPFGDDVLLACARSGHALSAGGDRNGVVYDPSGRPVRDLALGDGIASMQATAAGRLWVAYFDEGVFGGSPGAPAVGESGLVAFDVTGRVEWAFEPPDGLAPIADCYALNVASDDDAWCCYYTDFPLVHVRGLAAVASWQAPEHGSDAFAVDDDHALFHGGYDRHGLACLARIEPSGLVRPGATLRLVTTDGRALDGARAIGRGDALYLWDDRGVYRATVTEALCAT